MATVLSPAAAHVDGPLLITPEQHRQFDEDGFVLIEDGLTQEEVVELLEVVDELDTRYRTERNLDPQEAFQIRNIVAAHPRFRQMIDHPRILPLMVDVMGVNIHIRTSHMDTRPPMPTTAAQQELGARDSFFPFHSDGPNFGWPTTDGVVPYMEAKVAYYLTELTAHNSGAIVVVRGSHKIRQKDDQGNWLFDPADIVEVNVRPGTAMIWRTALVHAVTPNLSDHARKCLYYGYTHRWVRPSDYDHQEATALDGCTPIQLQLLGELGDGSQAYNGDDPLVHPISRFWRPRNEDIPLKAWAEAYRLAPVPV